MTISPPDQASSESFVGWLLDEVIADARGDRMTALPVRPDGRLWLGRLATETDVQNSRLGERSERLEPCEVGVRVRLDHFDGRQIQCLGRVVAWRKVEPNEPDGNQWEKSEIIEVADVMTTPQSIGDVKTAGRAGFGSAFAAIGAGDLSCEFHAELESGKDGLELVVTLVNVSPPDLDGWDTTLYEAQLEVHVGQTEPFNLDNLPDSFRYDRRVPAYGVNGGVEVIEEDGFRTTDVAVHRQPRPDYWDGEYAGAEPDVRFATLAADPVEPLRQLVSAATRWGDILWSNEALDQRQQEDGWSSSMRNQADKEAAAFRLELGRMQAGVDLLEQDPMIRRALALANRSFVEAHNVRHDRWRPFQLGFLIANLTSLAGENTVSECDIVDTLWFATGGGKTETYLLFVLTAAFYDRLRGKREGITSWGRFPLRMLSLQQTQRFADVLAAAELVRKAESIAGNIFSLGFLVGENGTPNRIERDGTLRRVDPSDPDMPARYQVLLRCPFCGSDELSMRFDPQRWSLDHICPAPQCPWGGRALPFRIVDDEIYRALPTVVLGTLDKAASISMQAAMRGFYAAPYGKCPKHGFTYGPRSKTPNGCLFIGCKEQIGPLAQDASLYAPTIRMQDELHLLRDSLGAVDSHYEALLDELQQRFGPRPKIIASSATLAGHDHQVEVLYRRQGRTFPLPGPRAGHSFWSRHGERLARCFAGLAPRGVTIEYATDQLSESLQRAVRKANDHPEQVASEAGVSVDAMPGLVWAYGTDVVYGTSLKDVEAASRSFDSQLQLEPLIARTLTGRTPLEEVRNTLADLTDPPDDFYQRIHLIAASSMLSHGVDVDRLNVMVMLGLPLATAEFIQTTSRVGRSYPGLVIVLHKIGRERDAAVFRTFPAFVAHADRLIDPVPITARSRRVLELTFAGLVQGRIYGIYEPEALAAHLKQLTTPASVRRAFSTLPVLEDAELDSLVAMLGFTEALDENLRNDLREYVREFFRALNDPASSSNKWVSDLFSTGQPMLSLRDVEEQAPVYSRGGRQ